MSNIHLKIRVSDIKHTNYNDANDCAITRALERASYPHFRDEGVGIFNVQTRELVCDNRESSYRFMKDFVHELYEAKTENRLFEYKDTIFIIQIN
jgi:hypothetical protein